MTLARIGLHSLLCMHCVCNQYCSTLRGSLADGRQHVRADVRCDRCGRVPEELRHGGDVSSAREHQAGHIVSEAVGSRGCISLG